MCVRPYKIKNNSLTFDSAWDKSYFLVPCGHCSECMTSRRADYEFRLMSQYKFGCAVAFFYTLTFNDDNLPRFEFPKLYDKPLPCFDKKLVQRFLKRLRHRLNKLHINLKYFISSEFGEKFHRPHHHAIFFLDLPLDGYTFRKLIDETWTYGFNCPGKNLGVISDFRPLSYCAKYVCKDLDFYKYFPSLDDLHKFYDSTIYNVNNDLVKFDVDDDEIKNCMPFHLQSTQLGVQILDTFKDENFVSNSYDFILGDAKIKRYSIPLYYLRKKLYNVGINENGNVQYKLNEYGEKIYKLKILRRVQDTILDLKHISQCIETVDFTKDYFLRTYNTDYLINMWKSFDDDFIEFFAKYLCFYQGCEKLPLDFYDIGTDIDKYFEFQNIDRDTNFSVEVDWLSHEWDVLALSELVTIYYRIRAIISHSKFLKQIHDEQIFKQNYYGSSYIRETETKVSYRSFYSLKFI